MTHNPPTEPDSTGCRHFPAIVDDAWRCVWCRRELHETGTGTLAVGEYEPPPESTLSDVELGYVRMKMQLLEVRELAVVLAERPSTKAVSRRLMAILGGA